MPPAFLLGLTAPASTARLLAGAQHTFFVGGRRARQPCGFFASRDLLWPGGAQSCNTRKGKAAGGPTTVLKHPATSQQGESQRIRRNLAMPTRKRIPARPRRLTVGYHYYDQHLDGERIRPPHRAGAPLRRRLAAAGRVRHRPAGAGPRDRPAHRHRARAGAAGGTPRRLSGAGDGRRARRRPSPFKPGPRPFFRQAPPFPGGVCRFQGHARRFSGHAPPFPAGARHFSGHAPHFPIGSRRFFGGTWRFFRHPPCFFTHVPRSKCGA